MQANGRDTAIFDLPIHQVLGRCPQLVFFFIHHKLACVGCSFSRFHSIHKALLLHDITADHAARLKAQVLADCTVPITGDIQAKGEDHAT